MKTKLGIKTVLVMVVLIGMGTVNALALTNPNPIHLTGSPIESEAVNHSNGSVNEDQYADCDWGAPGKQYKTTNWND